jgi:cyclopropane fatty-acyl-phospholipid synthase-like methyltransferase
VTGFDRETLSFYAAHAEPYLTHRPESVDPKIPGFLQLLQPGAHILELGCGGGGDAEYMISKGFNVEPTDGVAEMAAQAQRRLGRPIPVMRFDDLVAVEAYDAVLANASLLHVPVGDIAAILARVWRALKPGGLHFATYKTGATESRDEHGRYYNYLSREEAEAQYRAAGDWESLDYEIFEGVGYFSKPASWLKVVARKRA